MQIEIKMMGCPWVRYEGRLIQFKYQKAEAIFYYIAYHRTVERYRIMGIFWADEPEEKARKNLRNALYAIRQAFGADVLKNVGQRIICFTDLALLKSDLDNMWESTSWNLKMGKEEFLETLILKETTEYDQWVYQIREEIRESQIIRLRMNLEAALNQGKDPESLGKEIMRMDPFDEGTARQMIAYYHETAQHAKCIEIYSRLCQMLEEELSLKPEQETVRMFQEILESRRIRSHIGKRARDFFCGREEELEAMTVFQQKISVSGHSGLVMVSGEAGVGKTSLVRRYLIEQHNAGIRIDVTCHEGDNQHFLKIWYPIVLRIGEILMDKGIQPEAHQREILARLFPTFMNSIPLGSGYQMEKLDQLPLAVISRITTEVLQLVLTDTPLTIVIEDTQWIDQWSLELLKHTILEIESGDLQFWASYRNPGNGRLEHFISELERQDRLDRIQLLRFTQPQTEAFIACFPGQPAFGYETYKALYLESEGNALMLTELIKSLTEKGHCQTIPSKVRSIYAARMLSLNTEGRKMADLIAAFSEPVHWEDLRAIYGRSEIELLEVIDELIDNDIIVENEPSIQGIRYRYSHQKLKEFVYDNQSATRRKLIHKRIGDYYRNQLTDVPSERFLYCVLIYHYERAGDKKLHLEYQIRNLYDYLEISHELFPRIRDKSILKLSGQSDYNDIYIIQEMKSIERMMNALGQEAAGERLELEYLNMGSRYHLLQGDMALGREMTRVMIHKAELLGSRNFILKGYLQLIFNAINQRDIQEMEVVLRKAFTYFKSGMDKGEIGVFIRLKGYLMILKNQFVQGEALLNSAARIFESSEHREMYALNRVAAYFYLGESRRLQCDQPGALRWYREAERLCGEQGFSSHLAMVLGSIGITYYDNRHYPEAAEYLRQAVVLYDTLQFKWGQITAYAYWGLMCLRNHQYEDCLKNIQKADQIATSLGHVYETGLMLRVKAEICCILKTSGGHQGLETHFELVSRNYCKDAEALFKHKSSFTYEVKLLSDLKRICSQCEHY